MVLGSSDRPRDVRHEIDSTVVAEAGHWLPRQRIDADQVCLTRAPENPRLLPVGPISDASGTVRMRRQPAQIGLWVMDPNGFACAGIDRGRLVQSSG